MFSGKNTKLIQKSFYSVKTAHNHNQAAASILEMINDFFEEHDMTSNDGRAVGSENLNAVVITVTDNYLSAASHSQSFQSLELAMACSV